MMPLIFVVDGMAERRSLVQFSLERAGYVVEVFATGHAADIAELEQPSLIVLGIDLKDANGVDLRDRFRQHPILCSTPLLLLADSKIQKKRQLDNTDNEACLSYPFTPAELLTVINQILRRTVDSSSNVSSESIDIVIDPFAMKVSVRGREITTTTLEFRLLDYLARHQGKVFTRDALLDAVWGDLRFVTPRSVDACIRRIRRKIEPQSSSPQFLRTIRGIGYKLQATPTWEAAGGSCQCATCVAARERAKGQVVSADIERVSGCRSRGPSVQCNQ